MPSTNDSSIWSLAEVADLPGLTDALRQSPKTAIEVGGPKRAEPLAYVCLGTNGGGDRERVACAELLLAHGANPNGTWFDPDWPDPLPILYAATGRNNYPQLARVLLKAGAKTNDGESIYHAAEANHRESLEALAEAGADFGARHSQWGNTPLYFLLGHHPESLRAATVAQGIRWLLDHGADPNVTSYNDKQRESALHAAVNNGWPLELIRAFVDHGANPNLPRRDGRTPYDLAVRRGREDVAALLREHGASSKPDATDQFLGICWRGDQAGARRLIAADPAIVKKVMDSEPYLMACVAARARPEVIRLLVDCGLPVDAPGPGGETALLQSCWIGRPDRVKLLLECGANLAHRDSTYNADALGWCSHGSLNYRDANANHATVAELLAAAGATIPDNQRGDYQASPEVLMVLRRRG